MVFIKTLQARALLLLCNRVGPSSSRERRTATQSFSIEGNSLKRAGEEVEPWLSPTPAWPAPLHFQLWLCHTLNLCKTGVKLLIYFIWGLWSLINICAYFQMTGALSAQNLIYSNYMSWFLWCFIHLGFWTTNYFGQSTATVQHKWCALQLWVPLFP